MSTKERARSADGKFQSKPVFDPSTPVSNRPACDLCVNGTKTEREMGWRKCCPSCKRRLCQDI